MVEDLAGWITSIIDSLNERRFEALDVVVDEECVLDMPGGSRVIGAESLRGTLAEFLMRHEAQFTDIVVMTDAGGLRGAAEVTLRGVWEEEAGGEGRSRALPAVLVFERTFANGKLARLSIHAFAAI